MTARLQIDWTRCDGHGLCAALLPARVHLDKWGFPVLRDAVVPSGTDEELDVRHAVAVCPALALRLENEVAAASTTKAAPRQRKLSALPGADAPRGADNSAGATTSRRRSAAR